MEAGSSVRKKLPPDWSRITRNVIGAAIEVHSHLGPGRLESNYEKAMGVELGMRGRRFVRQRSIRALYKGQDIGEFQLDLVVEDVVVVELKAVERVAPVHLAQLVSYLRTIDLPLGLLINFNVNKLVAGVYRRLNPRCSLIQCLPDQVLSLSPSSHLSEFALEDDQ